MKKIYSLLSLFFYVVAAVAQSVTTTINFEENPFGLTEVVKTSPLSYTHEGVSFQVEKAKSTTGVYLSSTQLRFYKGNVMKLGVEGTITQVVFTASGTDPKTTNLTNLTQGETALGEDGTWTGSVENEIEFSNTAQVRVAKIEITYTTDTTDPGTGTEPPTLVAAPTFSLESGLYTSAQTLTLSSEPNTFIYYTWDGSTPTSSSERYTLPLELSEDGIYEIKAIAFNDKGEASEVASAQYYIDLPGIADSIYGNNMMGALTEFTIDPATQDGDFQVWKENSRYGATANGYDATTKQPHATASALITPVIDLMKKEKVFFTFEESANFFQPKGSQDNFFTQHTVVKVREEGGEWVDIELPTRADGNSNKAVNVGEVSLEAYKGKKIQIGFFYTSTEEVAGRWQLKNLYVWGNDVTGIHTVKVENAPTAIYDLSGRRVNKVERGIYIINGKKTWVK